MVYHFFFILKTIDNLKKSNILFIAFVQNNCLTPNVCKVRILALAYTNDVRRSQEKLKCKMFSCNSKSVQKYSLNG